MSRFVDMFAYGRLIFIDKFGKKKRGRFIKREKGKYIVELNGINDKFRINVNSSQIID